MIFLNNFKAILSKNILHFWFFPIFPLCSLFYNSKNKEWIEKWRSCKRPKPHSRYLNHQIHGGFHCFGEPNSQNPLNSPFALGFSKAIQQHCCNADEMTTLCSQLTLFCFTWFLLKTVRVIWKYGPNSYL